MKKKILILTYYWPPEGGAGVQRWLKFVKYLSKEKYEIIVYTALNAESPHQDESLLTDIPEDIRVVKKSIWQPFHLYKKITNKKGKLNAGFLDEEEGSKPHLLDKVSLIIRANLFIPDAKMFWIIPSVKFLKRLIYREKIDLVISSGPPHTLHIIAKKLQAKTKIKWIADFRDPWTNIDFYNNLPTIKITDKIHKHLECSVLKNANRTIVVGEEMKKEYDEKCPECNISVITNGYDTLINNTEDFYDLFTIVHIGSINADRSHESFYKAIHQLLNENKNFQKYLQLKFIGKIDSKARKFIKQYKLDNYFSLISYLPYDEVGKIQNRAHILYLPLNNSPNAKGILTGKFFEYLAARKFIIAQGPNDGDLSKIIKHTNSGEIFDFNDSKNIKIKIKELFEDYLNNKYNFKSKNIESFSREKLTLQLESVIDEIINQ